MYYYFILVMNMYDCLYMYTYVHLQVVPPECTASFHNFKSQNFKLSVSNPKSKYVAYFVRTVSNFKLPESRPQKQI